ncbi:hypothetical protein [Candidatus Tisiphia endosymbiont of Hybos culiciformis]
MLQVYNDYSISHRFRYGRLTPVSNKSSYNNECVRTASSCSNRLPVR